MPTPATGVGADLWALSDLATPWCVHVVATLGIAELAARAGLDVVAVARQPAGHLVVECHPRPG